MNGSRARLTTLVRIVVVAVVLAPLAFVWGIDLLNRRIEDQMRSNVAAAVQEAEPSRAAHDSLKDIAFQKLLLREKLLRGEKQVDNFDPNRPKEESLSDLELSLRLIEDEHIRISGQRAEILEMIAISQHFDAPGAIELLGESIGASREKTSAWRATHTRPTAEDYGVKAAALPSAASITEGINKELGFLGGLAKVAAGVVSANPGMALDGLSSLAPEDSSAQTSLRGLAAAVKGDLAGTIDAVAKLSGAEEAVDGVKDRLTRLESAVAFAKSRG